MKSGDKITGGKADKYTIKDIADKHGVSIEEIDKELKIGIKIELEHTNDVKLAREIAMDHLYEFPDYYTNKKYGLIAMEDKLKEFHNINESKMKIRMLLKETFDKSYGDDTIIFKLNCSGNQIGTIKINPNVESLNKYTIEIINLQFTREYDNIHTGMKMVKAIWGAFPDTQTVLITPSDDMLYFWEKIGAKRLNNTYWFLQRGH